MNRTESNAVSGIRTRTVLFGRQPLCRLELPPRESDVGGRRSAVRGQKAPSGNRTRDFRLGKAAFFAAELPAHLSYTCLPFPPFRPLSPSRQWARLESNQHLRFFRPPLDRRAADPLREAPPVGLAPTTSCVTSKRSCCLSYGDVLRCVFGCQRTRTSQAVQRRVKDSNLRSTSLRMPL